MVKQLRLDRSAHSPARARAFTRQVLSGEADELVQAVLLLVSELVTNAIEHARSDVVVAFHRAGDALRVEVCDNAEDLDTGSGEDDEHGRGLLLVQAVADAWGITPWSTGKAVWFEVLLPAR